MNTANPHQDFLHFFADHCFWQMKGHPVLTVCLYKTTAARTDFKKGPSKTLGLPIIQERNQPRAGTSISSSFFKFKERGWQQNKTTNKQKHEHPYTRMNNHVHPWTPMSTWARMSTHELTWIRVFPNTMQLANYLLNQMSHSFWTSYFGLLAMWVFDLIVLFLNWTLILVLCFMFFLFCPVVVSRPEKNLCWFLQNMISYLNIVINIYSYLNYLFIYSNLYIDIDWYIYICMYIYIYKLNT